jgi:hypothetical protein
MSRRLALVLLAVAFAACGRARIRDILDRPGEFEGKTVSVSGNVVESTNLLVLRFYKVDDGTGRIAVVTKRAVPAQGAQVTATGTVRQAFALGNDRLTVLVESEP